MSLEKETKNRRRKIDLQNFILTTIALTGGLAVAMVAPGVLIAMKSLKLLPHKRQEETIVDSQKRLIKKGLLKYNKKGELEITQKGKVLLAIKTYSKNKVKKKWDKK